MTNNEPDSSTKIVQNGKKTTADTAPETSWVPKNPPPAAAQAEPVRRVGSVTLGICLITAGIFFFASFENSTESFSHISSCFVVIIIADFERSNPSTI